MMTVAEVIDSLRKFNPESEVLVSMEDDGGTSPAQSIAAIGRVITPNGGSTYVQIEGVL